MFNPARSTANSKKKLLDLLAIILLGAAIVSLSGCAGLVSSANSSKGGGNPTPLTITNAMAASATLNSVQIDWTTSAPATSQVKYGKTATYGSTTGVVSTMVSTHQTPLVNLTPGTTYHFQVSSTDTSGISATSSDMTFTTLADTTPPTVSISSPAAGATISGSAVILSATASDNVAVASVQFKVDSANIGSPVTTSPYNYTLNTTTLSNANHTLTAVATDTAGNSATSAAVSVKVSNTTSDTTPPTVTMTAPANAATVSNTVLVSANASDNVAVASVQFQLDNVNLGTADLTAPYSFSWDTTKSTNGSHTLRAIATDTSNNSATSSSVTVTVSNSSTDTTPPTVSITAPANGATVSNIVTVSANASDNVAVASVQFRVDGANLGSAITTTPYSTSLDTTKLSNGTHSLTAVATDTSNNSATSTAVTVTVSNAGSPPPGTTITSFQLTSPLSGTFPFTVGLGFKKGDVPAVATLSAPNYQVIAKTSWSDGSVKHAVASGRVTLVANTPQTVNVISAASSPTGTAMTCSNIQTAAPSASVQIGSIGTVNLSSLLASPFRTWVSGPEMVECHYRSAVGSDPTLVVWFQVRLYADGRLWVRAITENGYLDVATANKSYVPTVIIGGTTVYNNGAAALSHYAQTRWSAEAWIGGDPQITPKHDTIYLEASKLLPNYMNQTPSAGALNGLAQTYSPMGNAGWTTDMGTTGFQNQIGLLPLWDALYTVSKADSRAYNAVITHAKALNSYAIVWNSSTTHLTPRPSDFPSWTIVGNNGGGATSVGAGPLNWDVAHHGSGGYLAYLITGDYYFLETMQDQAAMCFLMDNSANGTGTSRYINHVVQDRGVAWCYRTLSQYEALAPQSDSIVSDYNALLANSVTAENTFAQQANMNQLGYILSYDVNTGSYSTTASVLSPWQQHFMIQSIGMGVDLEPLADMTNWKALEAHLDLASVGILGPVGVNNYCFTDAYMYNLQVASTVTDPTNWYSNWGLVWTNNHGGVQNTSCGNTLNGTSGGDPANASTGYWGNLMPAIAYSVDHGATGAAASWSRLIGATNWSTVQGSGFGDVPIWGIVPRTASSNPPPPTTTVSVTSPTPGATVSGSATLTASASSSVGIASVQFQLDGANVGSPNTTAPYSMSWNTSTSTNGSHFLSAVATDTLGNLTASNSVNVTVSNTSTTGPVITAVTAVPSSTSATINWLTNSSATSQVAYGTTTSYGTQSPLNSTLVTSHSVALSGLTASTVYQFQVESTDASGNTVASANSSFTTTSGSGGPPPFNIPSCTAPCWGNATLPTMQSANICPSDSTIQGTSGCRAVVEAWGDSVYDTKRNRMHIWGGGHTDYYGNEIYAWDLPNASFVLESAPTTNPSLSGAEAQSDGKPTSRHTYRDLQYLPATDEMFSNCGALAGNPSLPGKGTWVFSFTTSAWTQLTSTLGQGTTPPCNFGYDFTAYDSNNNLVWVDDGNTLWYYTRSTNTYTQATPTGGMEGNDFDHKSAVVDPVNKVLWVIGGTDAFKVNISNLAAAPNLPVTHVTLSGCSALQGSSYPGLDFDTVQNLVVGWPGGGGNTIYLLNSATNSCTTVSPGGSAPAFGGVEGGASFHYIPSANVFIAVGDWNVTPAILRLTP